MSTLDKAIKIASDAFLGVYDNGGHPYIMHCIRVMNQLDANDSELQQIAILHDIIEDTDITLQDLAQMGFSGRVLTAINFLTHKKEDSYDTYIKLISTNKDAKRVKIADLIDNSNITRLKGLRKKDYDRLEKYHKAYLLKD